MVTSKDKTTLVIILSSILFIPLFIPNVNCTLDPNVEATVKNNIDRVTAAMADPEFKQCEAWYETFMGKLPPYGSVDTESIYSRFTQAYHFALPQSNYWTEVLFNYENYRQTISQLRDLQTDIQHLNDFVSKCSKALTDAASTTDDEKAEKANEMLKIECLEDETLTNLIVSPSEPLLHLVIKSFYESLSVVATAFDDATHPKDFNERDPDWDWSVFGIMYEDTLQFDIDVNERITTGFPAYIAKVQKDGNPAEAKALQAKLTEITARLADPSLPYKDIYFGGNNQTIKATRGEGNILGYKAFGDAADFLCHNDNSSLLQDGGLLGYVDWWRANITNFIESYDNTSVHHFVNQAIGLYTTYVKVEPTMDSATDANGILKGDGKWDWEPIPNPIHNMRLAWDLMGAVLEELKCYMRETYYFDLRQEALRKTQRDLKTGALFTGISRTMQAPCRFEMDDTDLTTSYCTRENNEICAPIPISSLSNQRTDSDHHSGRSLLKPKWIYKYDDKTFTCKGRKDYVFTMNVCRCGFRLDCGDDLGVNITCQLHHNDLLRGQCRGYTGFPCKTLPLSPGKHHESCRSGFCNMKKNSCEDRPYIFHKTGEGDRKSASGLLIMGGVGLIAGMGMV